MLFSWRPINLGSTERNAARRDADESEIFAAERLPMGTKTGTADPSGKKGHNNARVTWRSGAQRARCYVAGSRKWTRETEREERRANGKKKRKKQKERERVEATRKKGAETGLAWNVSGPHRAHDAWTARDNAGPH